MPTLLVIDRDDAFLPRGWVSAIIPDDAAPSDYEKGGGLWKAVSVAQTRAFKKRFATEPPSLAARSLIYDRGEIKEAAAPAELISLRLQSAGALTRPVPGPASLDRSHSTIWDYGPGRTYTTPQAAFDALLAQVGANAFTEAHYLRGWSGTYGQGPSGYVLYLTTVSPSKRYPLMIDAETGEQVRFDDELGNACLVGNGVSHVQVGGLTLVRGYVGIIPSEGVSDAKDWWVQTCEADGSQGGMQIGVSVYMADDLRVLHCDLHDLSSHGVGGTLGYEDGSAVRVEVCGCRIKSGDSGIWNNSRVIYLLAGNTIQAPFYGIRHQRPYPFVLAGMINNIFHASSDAFICIHVRDIPIDDMVVLHSDGNCFHPGSTGALANLPGQTLDLAGFQEWFGQDQRSIETDPLLDQDLVPQPRSPCLQGGVCWDDADWEGQRRAASVDIGFKQVSAKVPGVTSRRRPEIARRR